MDLNARIMGRSFFSFSDLAKVSMSGRLRWTKRGSFSASGYFDRRVEIRQLLLHQIILDDRTCRSDLRVHFAARKSDIEVLVFVSGMIFGSFISSR